MPCLLLRPPQVRISTHHISIEPGAPLKQFKGLTRFETFVGFFNRMALAPNVGYGRLWIRIKA